MQMDSLLHSNGLQFIKVIDISVYRNYSIKPPGAYFIQIQYSLGRGRVIEGRFNRERGFI